MKIAKTFLFSLLMIGALSSLVCCYARVNVVFDLGGVFFDRKKTTICKHAGLRGLTALFLQGKHPATLLFNILDKIDVPGDLTEEDKKACDYRGKSLPNGLLHWIKGNISGDQIIEAVDQYYEQGPYHSAEKKVIKRIVRAVFDPGMFEKTTIIHQQAIDFLEECINNGHNVYILSNLDSGSYEAMKKMLPGFFEQFDGVIISAEVKCMKPNPEIFSYHLLETYQLNPDDTVFIDDQDENLIAAEKVGIFPIKCRKTGMFSKSPNFKKIRQKFFEWKAERDELDAAVITDIEKECETVVDLDSSIMPGLKKMYIDM